MLLKIFLSIIILTINGFFLYLLIFIKNRMSQLYVYEAKAKYKNFSSKRLLLFSFFLLEFYDEFQDKYVLAIDGNSYNHLSFYKIDSKYTLIHIPYTNIYITNHYYNSYFIKLFLITLFVFFGIFI